MRLNHKPGGPGCGCIVSIRITLIWWRQLLATAGKIAQPAKAVPGTILDTETRTGQAPSLVTDQQVAIARDWCSNTSEAQTMPEARLVGGDNWPAQILFECLNDANTA